MQSTAKKHVYVSKPLDSEGNIDWTETENQTWNTLITRQSEIIKGRACKEYIQGIEALEFPKNRVPQLPEINKRLDSLTGFGVQGVPALIQPEEFFTLLANKKFPAATFIRIPEELDYIQEPDIFHEIFGHTPLLSNKTYASFLNEFGKKALTAPAKDRGKLFRLFWFTVEFGLVKSKEGERAYGSGILSSIGETSYCLTDASKKKTFSVLDTLRTPFRVDIMQPLYYVLNDFEDLFHILDGDVLKTLAEAKSLGDFAPEFPLKEKVPSETKGAMTC